MTASDARPPSDTGATACETCRSRKVRSEGVEWCAVCDDCPPPSYTGATINADVTATGITQTRMTERPGIWIDPAEARETIYRALVLALPAVVGYEDDEGIAWGAADTYLAHRLTVAVLAALGGQEGDQG